ncbi:DUF4375 domain-containing protein [Rhizobium leguminosarum]|uniref:DMP19 family protein n=1 Tax=Rhizobium leguminosarum TaxID=384 RepID=UPI001031B567|nr:DUF4375 domain-containing protein [Rhizobium leguminosarum]TAU37641.1 DUF4375 domain-containing protein [Rhizobium leguminosarum]
MNASLSIYLPASAMNDETSVVEEFFELMACLNQNHWKQHRKTLERGPEIDVYSALRYVGEVNNGGHNQYINNLDNDEEGFQSALSGLSLLGAVEYAAVLADMIDWARANPSAVEEMLSTSNYVKQPALVHLNDRFFGIDMPASVHQLASNWIKAHPRLKIVSEADFMAIRNGTMPE